jgi:hypothetical protein
MATAVMVFVAVLSIFVTRTARGLSHIMTFSAAVPTAFNPQPTFFCNSLQQNGGLQKMVDNVGPVTSTPSPKQLELEFVVDTSPDKPTHTAMVGLYTELLDGHPFSSTVQQDINIVTGMNPCAA